MKNFTEDQLKKEIQQDPKNSELHNQMGLLIMEKKDELKYAHRAKESFLNAIQLEPLNPVYHFELGNCYNNSGIWKHGASEKFKTCIYLGYKVDECKILLEEIKAFGINDNADRLNTYLGWLKDKPNEPSSYNSMSIYYQFFGHDFPKALEYSLKSLELDPDGKEGLGIAAMCYSRLKEYDKAIECIKRCLNNENRAHQDEDEDETEEKEQKMFYGQNDEDDADDFELYAGANDGDRDFDDREQLYWDLANVYKDSKQFDKAIECLLVGIKRFPGNAISYTSLGKCYSEIGENELAVVPFKKAISIEPEGQNWSAYDFLIQYYGSDKKMKVSEKYIKDAIKYNPDSHNFYFFMGVYCALTKNYDEAINYYLISLVFKPDFAPAYNNLCAVCIKFNQIDEGLEYLLNGLKVNPDMIEIHSNLKKLYLLKGFQEKANHHEDKIQELQIAGLFS